MTTIDIDSIPIVVISLLVLKPDALRLPLQVQTDSFERMFGDYGRRSPSANAWRPTGVAGKKMCQHAALAVSALAKSFDLLN